ncbi:hypothetical protein ACFQ0R_06390 [Psychroflexus salinarum]|uniref:Response regulator n=1 Tax=Psychroflexus salinarum TaxID=546024 RepID=A0ABW3GTW7_9FLAO
MALVAIIDDRLNERRRLSKRISRDIKAQGINWDIDHFDPLPQKEDYNKWIVQNKVVILIVDEKLKEGNVGGIHANYDGHDLVKEVRKTNKELPIVVISSYVDDEDELESMKGDFDDIISRSDFIKSDESTKQYVNRFIRYTQNYLENFEKEYLKLAELSELVALDEANENQINELKALQAKLELPLSSFVITDRKKWLEELESKSKKLEELSKKLETLLGK